MKTINIQPGHIARHTPRNAGAQGREAAVVDVAQDLLLQRLHDDGDLDFVAIKGGTAIRKLYAGNEGRFSLDLDFSVSDFDLGRDEVAEAFASAVDRLSIPLQREGAPRKVVRRVRERLRPRAVPCDEARLLARAVARARRENVGRHADPQAVCGPSSSDQDGQA